MEELNGETINVSLSGVPVQASRVLPPGSQVQVSLELSPQRKPIPCGGTVVRVQAGNQMGIQLDETTLKARE